jgi:pantoate--beta-alanine ligase
MVIDLDLGVQIIGAPLHRDPDGLAASSRNAYLSAAERAAALALSRALEAGRAAAPGGAGQAVAAALVVLDRAAAASPPVELDYLVLAEPDSFAEVSAGYRGPAILLVAAKVGRTRLIDNVHVDVGPSATRSPEVPGHRGLGWPQGTPCPPEDAPLGGPS